MGSGSDSGGSDVVFLAKVEKQDVTDQTMYQRLKLIDGQGIFRASSIEYKHNSLKHRGHQLMTSTARGRGPIKMFSGC